MEIQRLTKEIRDRAIERGKARTPEQNATSWYNEDLLYCGIGKTVFIILPTPGCSWALGDAGGCTMCSYISDCTLEEISQEKIVELFKRELYKHPFKEDYENGNQIAVKLFASGSFLNPREVPKEVRNEILEILNSHKEISEIVIETRPEYVKEEVLEEVFEIIGDKLFEVSIGLETSNDRTRELNINKGFSRADFENAVNIIKKFKEERKFNIKVKPYIFVKPILISEKEAIDEAIETGIYSEELGVDRLSYCPATIHGGTLIERLWRKGAYQAPWIWSCVYIINTIRKTVSIPSLMDTSGFGSRRGPYNCKKCNKDLKHMIIDSNLDQSIIEYECKCKDQWLGEVKHSNMTKSPNKISHIPLY